MWNICSNFFKEPAFSKYIILVQQGLAAHRSCFLYCVYVPFTIVPICKRMLCRLLKSSQTTTDLYMSFPLAGSGPNVKCHSVSTIKSGICDHLVWVVGTKPRLTTSTLTPYWSMFDRAHISDNLFWCMSRNTCMHYFANELFYAFRNPYVLSSCVLDY